MAATGGFSFGGATSSLSTTKPTGITFGTPSATTTSASGFGFGTPPTAASTGFSMGGTKTGGFSLGGIGTTTTGGGLLGTGTASTTSSGGLSLGLGVKPTTTTTSTASGLNFGATAASKPSSLFGATPATGTTGGFSLGGTAASGGLSLGLGTTNTASTGLSLGGLSGTTSTGLGLGVGTLAPSTGTGISKGLGGVDPSSLLATSSTTGTTGTSSLGSSDNKAIKETLLPPEINDTVTSFKKYVRKQKALREDIQGFSVKPYHRVREEITALKQLLAVVSNGLQRNAGAIHKLKVESAQELKNAEVAHRTQEIPPALQLENYAPTEYFQRLTGQFEEQMHLCRQQIEQMESFMAALAQPNVYTPQELATIMVKLNETFIALAAQLQSVHEAVRAQKEQYLNYRRVYHGETDNMFAVQKKVADRQQRLAALPTGPQAFDNISNAAAIAMATALQTAQRPTGIQGAGLTGPFQGGLGGATTGLGTGGFGTGTLGLGTSTTGLGGGLGTGLGTSGGLGTGLGTTGSFGTGFGTGGFGTGGFGTQTTGLGTQTAGLGTGLGGGTSGFGTGSNAFGFGTTKPTGTAASFGGTGSLSAGPTVGSTSLGFGAGTGSLGMTNFGSATTGKPLQLQKPPNKFRKGAR